MLDCGGAVEVLAAIIEVGDGAGGFAADHLDCLPHEGWPRIRLGSHHTHESHRQFGVRRLESAGQAICSV